MSIAFPSAEWVSAYGLAINASDAYRAASLQWTHGPVDHADTRSRHGLRIESGTLLHRTLEAVDASVNTRHHQAIRDVAPGLRATAWAEDGVIEGAERKDPGAPWALAVQWHPEDDVEDALFRGFAEATA